jgi:non-heme chloroperoxidase
MERLATDIVTVLDGENLQNPFLVGNGFAGEEMSWIAARFQRRIAGLIYLDAAYDRTNAGSEGAIARRIPPRAPGPQDLESAESMTRWVSSGIGFPIPEAEIRQLARFAPDGRVAGERTPGTVRQAIAAGIVKADYSSIRVPALAIYARPISPDAFPGCRDAADAAVRQACSELHAWSLRHLSDGERLFRTIPSRVQVIDLPGANPFVFLSNEREVTQALDEFVSAVAR